MVQGKLDLDKYARIARKTVAEGCVLLKNDKQALPFRKQEKIAVYVVNKGMEKFYVKLGNLTDNEREIILKGCLINYYKG